MRNNSNNIASLLTHRSSSSSSSSTTTILSKRNNNVIVSSKIPWGHNPRRSGAIRTVVLHPDKRKRKKKKKKKKNAVKQNEPMESIPETPEATELLTLEKLREAVTESFSELKRSFEAKTRRLSISMDGIQEQNRKLSIECRGTKTSSRIKTAQRETRKCLVVIDLLKNVLIEKYSENRDDLENMILKKTVGAPLRFMPQTRRDMREEIEELKRRLKVANTRPRKEISEVNNFSPMFEDLEMEIRDRFSECLKMKKEISSLEKLKRQASRVGKLESELNLLNDRHVKTKDELSRMRSDYEDKIRSHERFRRSSIANEVC